MIRFSRLPERRAIAVICLLVLLNLVYPQAARSAGHATVGVTEHGTLTPVAGPVAPKTQIQHADYSVRLPAIERRPARKTMYLTVTAYSSSVDETDGDPFTTASGKHTHDGTMAHNTLPFGTRVRFPDAFGDKIFTVEDRMNSRYGATMADIWFPSKALAKQWGKRMQRMEIL